METNPVVVHPPRSQRKETRSHPLVRAIDQILDEVIDLCATPVIENAFGFLAEQLGSCQTRKTVPVALLSHDPHSLTSAEVFARIEDFAEKSVRKPNIKIAYLRDLHCSKKTERVTEMIASAFERASLVYLSDFETYYIVLQNYEAWDKQVITNVFESLHDLLQDSNIRIGVFIEVSGDSSVFRAAMDYNIVFGLDIRESILPSFAHIKEMVFLMLMSVQGFPVLSARLAKEIFAAPSFPDVRKMLKFHIIRHFMSARLLDDPMFEQMYEHLRIFKSPLDFVPATELVNAKSGWIQAFGKLNVLLLSLQVPTETRLLTAYCHSNHQDGLPIDRLYSCLEQMETGMEWYDALTKLAETNAKISAQLQLLYSRSQKTHSSAPSSDVARARDSLDLFLASEERIETQLNVEEIEELRASFPRFVEANRDLIRPKQSRKDALLSKPMCEDAKFDGFKKTQLRGCIRRLFEDPLKHPEFVLREKCPQDFHWVLMDIEQVASGLTSTPQLTSPFLKSSVDLTADLCKELFYPHFFMGRTERIEKRLHPDISIVFHLISRSGKKVDISDVFDEFCGIVGRSDIPQAQSRFLRVLGELKQMGMLKEMKHKAKDDRIFIEKLLFAKSTSLN